jgi:6,7-dimethyl-8-ribityllumazine synthase
MKQAPRDRPSARGLRVAIVRSLFNRPVTDGLLAGARGALAEMGASAGRVVVYDLPGAFELPLAAQAAARTGRFDAVVALGAVIEGETDHYEHVAREAASGLAAAARETGVPVAFGVLTVRQEEHAVRRAASGPGNKGAEAARAAVATALALRAIRSGREGGRKRAARRRR